MPLVNAIAMLTQPVAVSALDLDGRVYDMVENAASERLDLLIASGALGDLVCNCEYCGPDCDGCECDDDLYAEQLDKLTGYDASGQYVAAISSELHSHPAELVYWQMVTSSVYAVWYARF